MRENEWKKFLEKAIKYPFSLKQKSKSSDQQNEIMLPGYGGFKIGPTASFIYSLEENRFLKIEDSVVELTGIPAEEYLKRTPGDVFSEMIDLLHIETVGGFIRKSFEFMTNDLPQSEMIYNLEYNICSRDGTRKRLISQYSPSRFNENGIPVNTTGVFSDITHIRHDGLPRLFVIRNNNLIYEETAEPESIIKSAEIPFSKTEIRLLQLTSAGLQAKEIAEKMNISISTLYTHRKNIKTRTRQEINKVISVLQEKGIICNIGLIQLLGEL